jgi:hypothetical protein
MERSVATNAKGLESRMVVTGGGCGGGALLSLDVPRFFAALASFSACSFSFFRRSVSNFLSFFLWP